jgi:hypothetical protein
MTIQRGLGGIVGMAMLVLASCSKPAEPMPTTHPVTGTVVYKQGGPVPGRITFQPMTDLQLACNGPIADDGTFTVSTLRTSDQQRIDGVPEGEYRVTVFPQATDQFIIPKELPGKVTVKAGENRFDFKIEKGKGK